MASNTKNEIAGGQPTKRLALKRERVKDLGVRTSVRTGIAVAPGSASVGIAPVYSATAYTDGVNSVGSAPVGGSHVSPIYSLVGVP